MLAEASAQMTGNLRVSRRMGQLDRLLCVYV